MTLILLDTHVILWWFHSKSKLRENQREAIESATPESPLLVSEISLWEVATLCDRGRIRLSLPLREWLERATAPPLVRRLGITPAVAAEISGLPPQFPRDPADRIIAATARIHGASLVTSDQQIIESNAVPTICD